MSTLSDDALARQTQSDLEPPQQRTGAVSGDVGWHVDGQGREV